MQSIIDKFWNKVDKTNTCWNWKGFIGKDGYGKHYIYQKMDMSHRISYQLIIGTIDSNKVIDHKCRNRACVNPKHLEVVSQRENVMRGNGIAKINSRKTHCIHGHEFTSENTRLYGRERVCKICARDWMRKNRKLKGVL